MNDPIAQIANAAAQQAYQQIRSESIVRQLAVEFPDIAADRGLSVILGDLFIRAREEHQRVGQPRDDLDILRGVANVVRNRYVRGPEDAPPARRERSPEVEAAAVPARSLREAPSTSNRPESAGTYIDREQQHRRDAVDRMMKERSKAF